MFKCLWSCFGQKCKGTSGPRSGIADAPHSALHSCLFPEALCPEYEEVSSKRGGRSPYAAMTTE